MHSHLHKALVAADLRLLWLAIVVLASATILLLVRFTSKRSRRPR
jgi:hypothetical protein